MEFIHPKLPNTSPYIKKSTFVNEILYYFFTDKKKKNAKFVKFLSNNILNYKVNRENSVLVI